MYTLNIEKRNLRSKPQELRNHGLIPGILYGPTVKSSAVKASVQELRKAVNKAGEVYEVHSENGPIMVKFDEVQRDAVNQELIHFSLVQMPKGVENHICVPIEILGTPKGAKQGGTLVLMKDEIMLKGTPSTIPDAVTADISKLEIGDKLTLGELKLPKGIEAMEDADEVVAICKPPVLRPELDLEETTLQPDA